MIQLIPCKNCGKPEIKLEDTYVEVNFKKSKYCDKCRNNKEEIKTEFFCSPQCFYSYYHKQ